MHKAREEKVKELIFMDFVSIYFVFSFHVYYFFIKKKREHDGKAM